jgi:hypothetical protein
MLRFSPIARAADRPLFANGPDGSGFSSSSADLLTR